MRMSATDFWDFALIPRGSEGGKSHRDNCRLCTVHGNVGWVDPAYG